MVETIGYGFDKLCEFGLVFISNIARGFNLGERIVIICIKRRYGVPMVETIGYGFDKLRTLRLNLHNPVLEFGISKF